MANPSVRHDFAYETQHGQDIYGAEYARKLADHDFLIDMLEAHVPSLAGRFHLRNRQGLWKELVE